MALPHRIITIGSSHCRERAPWAHDFFAAVELISELGVTTAGDLGLRLDRDQR